MVGVASRVAARVETKEAKVETKEAVREVEAMEAERVVEAMVEVPVEERASGLSP